MTKQKLLALEIYISGQVDTLNKTFKLSSAVAGRLFQILTMWDVVSKKVLSNISTTVTYKQFIKMSTCCFV